MRGRRVRVHGMDVGSVRSAGSKGWIGTPNNGAPRLYPTFNLARKYVIGSQGYVDVEGEE